MNITQSETHSWDRGADYDDLKEKLIKCYLAFGEERTRKKTYCWIALLQLYNACRISESCLAFKQFVEQGWSGGKVSVKISKSESLKVFKDGEKKLTKPRFRDIVNIPLDWGVKPDIVFFNETTPLPDSIKSNVLTWMLSTFKINTHSLRYATINKLVSMGKPLNVISKFIGHRNLNMLLTYTQQKEVQKAQAGL